MSRTYPQRVKSGAPLVATNPELVGHSKQVPAEVNRRACTSAAVLGLAISMGASSLLMPQQNDGAIASEPLVSEPSLTDASAGSPSPVAEATNTSTNPQFPTPEIASANVVIQTGNLSSTPPSEPLYEAWQVPSLVEASQDKPQISSGLSLQTAQSDLPAASNLTLKLQTSPAPVAVVERSSESFGMHSNGASVSQVALRSNRLRDSQGLKVLESHSSTPDSKSSRNLSENLVTYRVNVGDTLNSIARNHGVSVVELATINGIHNPNVLWANQVLKIRSSESRNPDQETSVVSTMLKPSVVALSNDRSPNSSTLQASTLQASTLQSAPAEPTLMASVQTKVNLVQETVSRQSTQVQPNSQGAPATEKLNAEVTNVEVTSVRQQPVQQQPVQQQVVPQVDVSASLESSAERAAGSVATASGIEAAQLPVNQLPVNQLPTEQKALPTETASVASSQPSVPSQVSSDANLDIVARNQAESLQAEVRSKSEVRPLAVESSRVQHQPIAQIPVAQEPSLYAAAPAGSDNYAPIAQPLVGQTVSPDLPGLGTADKYLPNGSQDFNGYVWPARGVLTSGYGWRWGRMHRGIDIAAPIGTPVVAAAPGVVVTAGWNSGGYGNLVEIQHPDGSLTLYGHNNRILVQVGQQVEQGQQISEMGSTGYSTGPHLHFEVHPHGQGATNPMAFLPGR